MDDTNWITSSKSQTEEILNISHDFFNLNNILVNDYKAELMTTTVTEVHDPTNSSNSITLPICLDAGPNRQLITLSPLKSSQSTKFLGVWISLKHNKPFVAHQLLNIIQRYYNMMRFKKLTDRHLEFILRRIIGPQIEYLAQLTIFSEAESNKFSYPLRRLFKN